MIDHMFFFYDQSKKTLHIERDNADGERAGSFNRAIYTAIPMEENGDFISALTDIQSELLIKNSGPYVIVTAGLEKQKGWWLGMCEQYRPKETPFPSQNPRDIFYGRAWIDILQLAWPLHLSGAIRNRSLTSIAGYYGIEINDDVLGAISSVYWLMMKRYSLIITAEDNVRGFGSEIAGGLMNTVAHIFSGAKGS